MPQITRIDIKCGISDDAETKNRLTVFDFKKNTTAGTVYYKQGINSVGTHFFVSSDTPLFMISNNDELEDKERGNAMGFTNISNDYPFITSNLKVYDVDKNGLAHAAVYICSENEINGVLDANSESGIVQKISPAVNDKGDTSVTITLCLSKSLKFETYFVKELSLLSNLYTDEDRSSYPLSSGDIVRFVLNPNNEICNITKDFDASSKTILYARSGENEILRYYMGTAYAVWDSAVNISAALKPVPIDMANGISYCLRIPSNVLLCDGKSVRPVSKNEITAYTDSKDEADTVVMRTRYLEGSVLIIYR